MTLGTKSLLVVSLSAALFASLGAACKKKEPAATGSGSATGAATGTAAPAAIDAPAVDAAEAAPAAIDAAEAAAAGSAATLTPELEALFDTITPILAMEDGDARNKTACKTVDVINAQMRAVDKNPPAGVDAAAWTAVVESMASGMNDFAIECGEGESPNLKALSDALEAAKELEALVAKKAN